MTETEMWIIGGVTSLCVGLIIRLDNNKLNKGVFEEFKDANHEDHVRLEKQNSLIFTKIDNLRK